MSDMQRGFGSHPVPAAVAELWVFQVEVAGPYSGNFELTPEGDEALLADGFVVFGKDAAGSLYGFWLHPGRTLADAPVAYLNAERCDNTVLASSFRDFLALLALDLEEPGLMGFWGEQIAPTAGHERFLAWAAEKFGIAVPEDPERLVREARAAHPDFDAWVEDRLTQEFDE